MLDEATLRAAVRGQNVVDANLAGAMAEQARAIIDAMLDPYRDSAALIEQSELDYTILRPGWFTRDDKVDYQVTQKGEPFRGHDVSLNSLSDLITRLATTPRLHSRCSLGVSRG